MSNKQQKFNIACNTIKSHLRKNNPDIGHIIWAMNTICETCICDTNNETEYKKLITICKILEETNRHGRMSDDSLSLFASEVYCICENIYGTSNIANLMIQATFTIMDAAGIELPMWVIPIKGSFCSTKQQKLRRSTKFDDIPSFL